MIKQGLSIFFLVLAFQISLAKGASADEKPNHARIMWSAFSCSTFAEMSGNTSERERLFKVGYKAGRAFVDGVKKKTLPETEAKDAPIGVLMRMSGPTTDFVIGRIFEAATDDAYDKVVKEDSSGMPILDPSKWADDKLKVIKAQNEYQNANCTLIRSEP